MRHLQETFGISERRACRVLGQPRATQRQPAKTKEGEERLVRRLLELVRRQPRYGYRRMWALLRREGWRVNRKRVYRLWRQQGLKVPRKQRKKRRLGSSANSCVRRRAQFRDHVWAWDFLHDRTSEGRSLKWFTLVDEYTRECLALEVGRGMTARGVIPVLAAVIRERGTPGHLRSDNGPEFIAHGLRRWLAAAGVETLYIEPGAPWENGYAESFNSKVRDELLEREEFTRMGASHMHYTYSIIPFVAMISLLPLHSLCAQEEAQPSVTVMTTKTKFAYGEPIEIKIVVLNRSTKDLLVPFDYPALSEWSGLKINYATDKLIPRKELTPPREPTTVGGYEIPVIRVNREKDWMILVYLQRYFQQPQPGSYKIACSVQLTYLDKPLSQGGTKKSVEAQGQLAFSVELEKAEQFRAIFGQYVAKQENRDRWQRQFSSEALCVVEDPQVIPYLAKIPAQDALKALRRFPKDRAAQSHVLKYLTLDNPQVVGDAVDVLAEWKYELKLSEVQNLLKRDENEGPVFQATVRYIKTINRKDYLELIEIQPQAPEPPNHSKYVVGGIALVLVLGTLCAFLPRYMRSRRLKP